MAWFIGAVSGITLVIAATLMLHGMVTGDQIQATFAALIVSINLSSLAITYLTGYEV